MTVSLNIQEEHNLLQQLKFFTCLFILGTAFDHLGEDWAGRILLPSDFRLAFRGALLLDCYDARRLIQLYNMMYTQLLSLFNFTVRFILE